MSSLSAVDYFTLLRDKEISVVVDDENYCEFFNSKNYRVCHFDDFDFHSNEVIFLLVTSYDYQNKIRELWDNNNCIICLLSIAKFLPNVINLSYTFDKIIKASIGAVLEQRQCLYRLVENYDHIDIKNVHTDLKVELFDEIDVANYDVELQQGWLYSIPELFEASFVNMQEKCTGFNINGEFEFDGLITAAFAEAVRIKYPDEIDHLFQKVNVASKKRLIIRDNKVESLIVDGEVSHLLKCFDFEIGYEITELAFGCNHHLEPIDWSINSVANEGVYGTHIGIGMGKTAPHIDFIAKNIMPQEL